MKVLFEERGDSVIFRVYDFDSKYEKILKMCYYEFDANSYIKKFPKNTKNLKKIQTHYSNNFKEMFDQLGYFRPIPWQKALLQFIEKVQEKQINWWLTGSCAACIRGITLNPHDIDIMVDSEDINKINEVFKDYIIEPIIDTNGWLTKEFGVIFLHARIDIASDPQTCLDDPEPVDCGPYARANLEEILWNGHLIKVPPVNLQLNVNKRRGRLDRVKLIQEFIKKQ
ncbi:MAG: hypothetical protein JJT76_03055 [Clostridiaceae bacterium]|nr:hypothetical protein [Clostridiaceae bacterium]